MAEKEERRIAGYDKVRFTAILFVVLYHLLGHLNAEQSSAEWWIFTTLSLLFSSGNGLFFMLSGRFALRPSARKDPAAFYRRRAVSIWIPFLMCAVFSWWMENRILFTAEDASFLEALICRMPSTQYWFVFTLTGLLAMTPFLTILLDHLTAKMFRLLVLVILIFQNLFVLAKDLGLYPGYEFFFSGWVLFFLLGAKIDGFRENEKRLLCLLCLPALLLSLLQIRFLPQAHEGLADLALNYTLLCTGLFLLLQRLPVPGFLTPVTDLISRNSYYIYLLHNLIVAFFFSDRLPVYSALTASLGTPGLLAVCLLCCLSVPVLVGTLIEMLIVSPLKDRAG